MMKTSNPPFVVKFIGCPPDLDSDFIAKIFGIKVRYEARTK